ncbi:MAG: antiterminator LoaP [Oscillibacter sp.]
MKNDPAWYVIQVLTGTEEVIAEQLNSAGMEALAPAQVLHERRHGKWWPVRRIVFPGYVFVRVDMVPRAYYYIKQLPHVIRLLGTDSPEAVPDEQMEIVQAFANDGRDFGMSEGDKIDGKTVITSGPLAQLEGKIVKVNVRARRATVEVPILNSTYQVDAGIIVNQADTPADEANTT